jgi:predicted permease
MSRAPVWLARIKAAFQKEELDTEFHTELKSHLELHEYDNVRAGMSPEEARRNALIRLGGVEQIKEAHRESRGIAALETLGQDLRFGARMLRKNPGFTSVAVIALALGIGFSSIVFSIFYNGVLHPFPYRDADRLAALRVLDGRRGPEDYRAWFHLDEINAFRQENHTLDDIVGMTGWDPIYTRPGFSEPLHGCALTPNAMSFWGVRPLLGRGLTEQDAANRIVLLSFSYWKKGFNGDPGAVGATMLLNGQPYSVIGVMPQRFGLYGADFYTLIDWNRPEPTIQAQIEGEPSYFLATAIVKPDVTADAVAADLQQTAQRLALLHKDNYPEKFRMSTSSMVDSIIGDFRHTLFLLTGSVALLLFISSSNVASLLLVHNSARAKEISLRKALGAGRARLIRQLLIESLLLGAVGCVAGCLLAVVGLRAAITLGPGLQIPGEADIHPNLPVLLFAVGISLLTTLFFGLSPAIFAVGKDLRGNMQSSGVNSTTSRRGSRIRAGLVVGQVALSLLLLVFAGLMIRSFIAVTSLDLGVHTQNVLIAEVHFPPHQFDTVESKSAYFQSALARIDAIPGVLQSATAIGLPMQGGPGTRDVTIIGRPHTDQWTTAFEGCSEGYFDTLGLPLLRGRLLSSSDIIGARPVAVVNHTLVQKYLGGENPIGQQIKFNELDQIPGTPHDAYFEIIGEVGDFRNRGINDSPMPEGFIPYTFTAIGDRSLLVRTARDPLTMLNSVRQVLAEVNPNPVLAHPGTLNDFLQQHEYLQPRFRLISFTICAGLGLGLSMIGLFGVMAYSVALQTHDLGVRMALGAQQGNILSLVLRQGLLLVGGGIALGLLSATFAARGLQSQLWGVSAFDAQTFVIAPLALLLTGLAACAVPAWRASRVDPLVALRYE